MTVRDDKNGWYLAGIWLGIPALVVVLALFNLTNLDLPLPTQVIFDFLYGGLALVLIYVAAVQFPGWRQVNRRRQAAASGDFNQVPLASIQPAPHEQALTLPFTLRLRVNWLPHLGLIVFLAFLTLVPEVLDHGSNWLQWFESNWGNQIEPFVIFSVGTLTIPFFKRPKIQVTPNALMIGSSIIHWSDAKLFAIRGSGKPGDPARQFELSGAKEALAWEYLRPNRWWSFYKPPMPPEEYEQQMTRLLEYIAARTSLPLYYVR